MKRILAVACVAMLPKWAASADPTGPIVYYDMTALNNTDLSNPLEAHRAWDTAHLVASLQGIVNREGPRLFVRFMPEPDDFWWEYVRGESGWLTERTVERIDSLEDLLKRFEHEAKGVVVYDEKVAATSNLASTIAGVEDRLCLRYDERPDSVYQRTMASGLSFTRDVTRLYNEDGSPLFTGTGTIPGTDIPSTGSAKCDAHLWAKAHYLDKGLCSKRYLAYYLDAYWLERPAISGFSNATLTNHDFFIANRAFFFDLHSQSDETPLDDPDQKLGLDVETLKQILKSACEQSGDDILHIGGFTPWAWKYTDHAGGGSKHGGVDTEWAYARIISAYNGIMDADALGLSGMANASFYQHFPLRDHYPQNQKPTLNDLREQGLLLENGTPAPKTYVCFYMGDYDSAAWFNTHVPKWWNDPAHGETLGCWAFNPNLDRRAPHAMHYVRTHQSPMDWFMFGDSGAGYLNPSMLLEKHRAEVSGLPSGMDAWIRHCRKYAEKYDLSITGFIIDGHSPGMGEAGLDAYAKISPDGIVGQKIPFQGVHKGMPYLRMRMDLHGVPPSEAGKRIARLAVGDTPAFHFVRTILMSPSAHQAMMAEARKREPNIEFVDPYTFFLLLKAHEE